MNRSPHRVVIAGGGVAGVEALLALHALAPDRIDLTLVSPTPDFVYRRWPSLSPSRWDISAGRRSPRLRATPAPGSSTRR
jgi:hypothetical protein